MTDTLRLALHRAVLADMNGSKPKRLVRALDYQAEDMALGARDYVTESDFAQALSESHSTDPLVELWRRQLTQWDYRDAPEWSNSDPRTVQRREDVYRALDIDSATKELLTGLIEVPTGGGPVVISGDFEPWYRPQSEQGRPWYWPSYRKLLTDKGWPIEAVAGIDEASNRIVERLADPTRLEAYQSKGLVVGYVQSGKTANFTGVIAKAIDAGYRLVIVLSGRLDLLREQTQRRLDIELVGRENILRGASDLESEYADDPAWIKKKFVSFGQLPSALGAFDIVRLTTREDDYQSLLQGIVALESEKRERGRPLYDPLNLHHSSARLMVVKKNEKVLAKLLKDLRKLKTPLGEIPALIIDDESDEASLNGANLAKPDAERTAINQKISELLSMLPRAQYVGYTATPFANVFVDPSDSEDIFPKDFIISLPRPYGYMGASDFHDLDSDLSGAEKTVATSNEMAHVRDIVGGDGDDACLQHAIDSFVLSAAIKLYREDKGGLGDRYFQHHTMLIHESGWQIDHRQLLGRVKKLWFDSGYTGPRGHSRLRKIFESDVAPVSANRAEGYATPERFEDIVPYVGPASIRIGGDDNPVIVVNGDTDIETGKADFDKRSIWKILIGGQKLSRGFTVEGLTVTYFRRRTGNASSLMQMGRWFGFRDGYRDLVRLYIGRLETVGKKEIDLYEAFEAVCLDESSFRAELAKYSVMVDGKPQITPAQVPPLVSQHLSWLKPASPNKMYNARLAEVVSPGEWREPTAYPVKVSDLRTNTRLWTPVLASLSTSLHEYTYESHDEKKHRLRAFSTTIKAIDLLEILEGLRWHSPVEFSPHLSYLRSITRSEHSQVDDWVVFAPQHARFNPGPESAERGESIVLGAADREFSWFSRDRRRGPLFGIISDPKHRAVPLRVAGALPPSLSVQDNAATEDLAANRRGAVVIYPVVESKNRGEIKTHHGRLDPGKIVMAFDFVAPSTAHRSDRRVIRFVAADSSKENVAIIDSATIASGD